MSSYIYRPDFANLYYILMADDDVWNIKTCSENWKVLFVFKCNPIKLTKGQKERKMKPRCAGSLPKVYLATSPLFGRWSEARKNLLYPG